jgi:hypothetical protein
MGSFRIFRLLPVGGESRGQNGFGGFVNGFAGFVFEAVLLKAKDLVASFRKFIFARKTADVVPTASLGTWAGGECGHARLATVMGARGTRYREFSIKEVTYTQHIAPSLRNS